MVDLAHVSFGLTLFNPGRGMPGGTTPAISYTDRCNGQRLSGGNSRASKSVSVSRGIIRYTT